MTNNQLVLKHALLQANLLQLNFRMQQRISYKQDTQKILFLF